MEEGYDDESGGDEDEDMEGYDDMEDMSEGPTESGTESGSDDEEPLDGDLIADENDWEDEDDDGIVGGDGEESDDEDEMHFDVSDGSLFSSRLRSFFQLTLLPFNLRPTETKLA